MKSVQDLTTAGRSRTYHHNPLQIIITILIFGILAFILFISFDVKISPIFFTFGIFVVLMAAYSAYTLTARTTISDTEISIRSILATRSLAWNEISRVSGRHYGIKLHNYDGDVTVSPSPQLPGYEEVVEFIGAKRPDLFSLQEYSQMQRNWLVMIVTAVVVMLIVGIAASSVINTPQWFLSLFFLFVGLIIVFILISSPQSITIDGNSLFIKYLFGQKRLQADEIGAIQLNYQRSRNGRTYYILLELAGRKSIRITSMSPSLPIVYLVLRNWYKKYNPSIANRDIV